MCLTDAAALCTCPDRACPHNPANHNQGCTPCIAKNLRAGEIPTCFFKSVSPDPPDGYTRGDFARFVLSREQLRENAPAPADR